MRRWKLWRNKKYKCESRQLHYRWQTTSFATRTRLIPALCLSELPGQGLVEFALALPILMTLIFGIIEGGHLMFSYISLASAGREASRYAAGIGNDPAGTVMYNDCAGIRNAAKRIGSFAGVDDADIQIFHDAGPGTAQTPYCNPSATAALSRGDRIVVQINANYAPIVPLIPLPAMTLHTENAHTLLEGAEVEAVNPPVPPSTSLVCDMSPYSISETSSLGPVNVITIHNGATATSIQNILLIWEGTGGPVLQSISNISPGPGTGLISINSIGPSFSQNVNWNFPNGDSTFSITFSKVLKSPVIIRLTLAGENGCTFGK